MYNTLETQQHPTVDWDTMTKKKESGRVRGKNVDILDDTVYDQLAEKAEQKDLSLRVHVNQVLRNSILTDKALTHYYPNLQNKGFEDGIITIRDNIADKAVQVRLKKKLLHCDLCESVTCIHTCYASALPEFGYLFENTI
jgi:hypothetical protein